MIPTKYDFDIYRGADFDVTLLAQLKSYLYDLGWHKTKWGFAVSEEHQGDARRSLAENLKLYGHTYSYINFLDTYTDACMTCKVTCNDVSREVFSLTIEDNGLTLLDKGVRIYIPASVTKDIDEQYVTYELDLYVDNKVDRFIYGTISIIGGA